MPTLAACLTRSVLLSQQFTHHSCVLPQSQLHTSAGTSPYEVLLLNVSNMLSSIGMVLYIAQLLGIVCTLQPRIASGLISSFPTFNGISASSFLLFRLS